MSSYAAGLIRWVILTTITLSPTALAALTPTTRAALPPAATTGRGAETPFVTYEAEDGASNGTIIGPDRALHTLASEASGRRAIRLAKPSEYVELELAFPANGLTVRYSIPDGEDGRGLPAKLLISADGKRIAALPLTSRYSWFYDRYPFTNRPGDGGPRRFYDHARILLPHMVPPGTRLRLSLAPGARAGWAAIDLVDAEEVPPPKPAPSGSISVSRFGADPTGRRSSAAAFDRALASGSASGRPVWIPPGEYRIDRHVIVDRVKLIGAGQWYSVLRGNGVGVFGRRAPRGSTSVELRGFAIIGEVTRRDDRKPLAAIGGSLGNSTVQGLWLQHTKGGIWIDGPADRLTISDLVIVDQAADGVNFHGGVTNSIVRNSFVRGSGDDGLAMWSHRRENVGDSFERNTIVAPFLANGIALYGGHDLTVSGNLVADSVTEGGGIHLGSRFHATPFAGNIAVRSNTIVRGGDFDPNWKFGVGAFWIYALDRPIAARIDVTDLQVVAPRCAAIQFIGKTIEGVSFDRVRVEGPAAEILQIQASGSATFRNTLADWASSKAIRSDGSAFAMKDAGDNGDWIAQRAAPISQAACSNETSGR